ncbi:MAG: NTP transferase domain-containing protein [Aestuariivirgaceae bacterium]|nr:NTP transferase domain-containing protein [Aestuariivirgaceae bacterium]
MMPLVIIPARMKSARLPDKPLQRIGGDPLILHCWRRAMEAGIGPVHVAADDERILEIITRAGGSAVLTGDANCGSDRVAIAAEIVDPAGEHQIVMNQQGDMPFINPAHLREFAAGLGVIREMATAVCEMGLVEVRGQDFFRTSTLSHIGLYAFTRSALRKFHALPQTARELDVRLEQLRAVGLLDIQFLSMPHMPQEVNTPEDLDAANALMAAARA